MLRSLAALGLSLSLALGAGLAPAQAQIEYADPYGLQQPYRYAQPQYGAPQQPQRDNAAAAALAALLALGVLGAIADDDDDDDDRDRVEVRRRADDWSYDGRNDGGRVLTADCVRHVHGGQRVLAGECLRRHGYSVRHLPDRCLSWVRSNGRDHQVYDMRCLRGSGFYVR